MTNKLSIIQAVHDNDENRLVELIGRGADINETNIIGANALMVACSFGHDHIAKKLINEGIDINFQMDATGNTALMRAAENGKDDCLMLLLNHGADISRRDKDGMTALMYAVLSGMHVRSGRLTQDKSNSVCQLLAKDVNSLDFRASAETFNGRTALMFAAMHGFVETYSLLVNAGANFTLRDSIGMDSKKIAIENKQHDLIPLMDSIHENYLLQRQISCNSNQESKAFVF